jgi:hypothetical protein
LFRHWILGILVPGLQESQKTLPELPRFGMQMALPHGQYRLFPKPYSYRFCLMPITNGKTAAELKRRH